MSLRNVKKVVKGHATIDGAGVHLTRVLGTRTIYDYDPFLMLDSFDSTNPADYIKGFPLHPHRGIETITYLIHGEMEHKDNLGNKGVIRDGQSQWMTAGSGILHQEMPSPVPRILGVQIWLNLPKEKKMIDPKYFDITEKDIKHLEKDFGKVNIISGLYDGVCGVKPPNIEATLIDFVVDPGKKVTIPAKDGENAFVFLIVGDALIMGKRYSEKSAVLFDHSGDSVEVEAPSDSGSRFIFFMGKPLKEPISWGGPIVMNTDEELRDAFMELEQGTFIKHNAKE
jgi:redox-sensitive bicupin YhaK (pirin superfamily)